MIDLRDFDVLLRAFATGVAAIALAACSSSAGTETTPQTSSTGQPTPLRVALASTDLAVGPNRFAFGVLDEGNSALRVPEARATFMYLDIDPPVARARADVAFVEWPVGRAGVYVGNVTFDQPGRWGVVVGIVGQNGEARLGQAGFVVAEKSSSPGIGERPPASVSKTASDVSDLSDLTTEPEPDPGLYQMTIADALGSGRPTVVVFATPAYCQTATCGPQVDVVTALKDRHEQAANFIHVEVYDNPNEIQGDLSKARVSPVLEEWGLRSEPFTFVLDSDGIVSSKYEGFVTEQELEAGLTAVLSP